MHERALMTALVAKIVDVARAEGAGKVTRVTARLGALSHFTPEHFREHFVDASGGTVAEGALVDAEADQDVNAPDAAGVVLVSVEIEAGEPAEVS